MTSTIASTLLPRSGRGRAERRGARRQAPIQLTPCRLTFPDKDESASGWVHNLSVKGAGLLLPRPCMPGATVSILLVNTTHTCILRLEMQVVRCERVVNGDHLIGGQFLRRLDFAELVPFFM